MSQELMIKEDQPLSVEQVVASVARIQQVLEATMEENVHFGIIPGCKKPTLYKAGAEKLLMTFRIAPDPQDNIVDLSTPDSVRYRIIIRGIHIPSGRFVGTGIGECSSDEEKYRWRKAVCREEYDEADSGRKRTKWMMGREGRPYQVQQVRTSPADVANTILKMAKKRALTDLALTATAASDIFEQDIEDLPQDIIEESSGQQGSGKPKVEPPKSKSGKQKAQPAPAATENHVSSSNATSQEGPDPSSPWTIERIIATIGSGQTKSAVEEAWKALTPHIAKLDAAGKAECQKTKDATMELLNG